MAYDKEKLFKKAKHIAETKACLFIDDVVSYLPCHKATFYDKFPLKSEEMNTIKDIIEQNRSKTKIAMRSKWFKSSNPTLQISLMKLICNDEERKKLAVNYQEHSGGIETSSKLSDEELDKRIDELLNKARNHEG